ATRCAVRTPRVLRHGIGAGRARRREVDDARVLRHGAPGNRPHLHAGPSRCTAAPPTALRDRQLDNPRRTAASFQRTEYTNEGRPCADRAARATAAPAWRETSDRP